jgi:predicted GNAT family acetyltransferase
MDMDVEKLEIVHNAAENRFESWMQGKLCKLDYLHDGDTFVITHVGVHPEFRGQGLAGKLVQAGLEYAKERSLRVIPMCSYAAAYIRKHPQYMDLTKHQAGE